MSTSKKRDDQLENPEDSKVTDGRTDENKETDDEDEGREVQSSGRNAGLEDDDEEPIRSPGGDGRATVRSDGRNDGKPDAAMPNLDGSRK